MSKARRYVWTWRATLFAGLMMLLLVGCDSGPGESLYEDGSGSYTGGDPKIESLDPAGRALAGVGSVTIRGKNFKPDTSATHVYFNGVRAKLLKASPTQLQVRPPDVPADSVSIRVSVVGAENLGITTYRLDPAVARFGGFKPGEKPWAIATDAAANVYVSLVANGSPVGIKRITPDGERSDFSPPQPWRYSDLSIGMNGALFGARGLPPIVYRAPDGGGELALWLLGNGLGAIRSLDVDPQGVIWAGGDNDSIYRITQDSTVTAFDFTGDVRALHFYDNYLYVAAIRDSVSSIWRAPLESDGLGAFEEYFALSDAYDQGVGDYGVKGAAALALAFAQDGTMYVGTDAPAGLVAVAPGGGSAKALYPGLFEPSIVNLAWGKGRFLYATRTPSPVANDVGSDLPQTILRIDTQKRGVR